jgi:AcrR family transcriptional regulator
MPKVLSPAQVEGFRDRLIETAERLFAERGPDGVTMRQLAAELGVSAMTPYRYFRDKDDILAAVRTRGFDQFAAAMEDAFASSPDPAEASQEVGRAYVRFALSRPSAYHLMFDFAEAGDARYPELMEASRRARTTLTAHARNLIDHGVVEGDALEIAHMLWAALHGNLTLQMAGKLDPALDAGILRARTFRAIIRGLAPAPAS